MIRTNISENQTPNCLILFPDAKESEVANSLLCGLYRAVNPINSNTISTIVLGSRIIELKNELS